MHDLYPILLPNRRTNKERKTLARIPYRKPRSTLSILRTPPFNLSRLHHRTSHTARVGPEPEQSDSEAAQHSLSRRLREVVDQAWDRAVA